MPTTPHPTAAQIDEAKRFILQRISNQDALEEKLEFEFQQAAEEIAHIILKYKNRNMRLRFTGSSAMAREIQAVIDHLESLLDYYVDYYSIPDEADESDEAAILVRVHGEDHGATYAQRRDLYLSMYLTALSGADFSDYIDEDELVEVISSSTSHTLDRLSLLVRNSVAVGFAFWALENAKRHGATGFISYISSSNPCKFCSSVSGILQPLDNYPNGAYHPNCQCFFVFV